MKKATTMIVHASGHSVKITRPAAAEILRKSRGEVRRRGDAYQIGSFDIKIARTPRRLDLFTGIEQAARAFGVPEFRLHDAVTGWRVSAGLLKLWNQWLKANPEYIPLSEAARQSERPALAA